MSGTPTTEYDVVRTLVTDLFYLDELPDEEREEAIARMMVLVYRGSVMQALEEMTEEEAEAFTAFLDTNPEEKAVIEYLMENARDFDLIIEEVTAAFMMESLNRLHPGMQPTEESEKQQNA